MKSSGAAANRTPALSHGIPKRLAQPADTPGTSSRGSKRAVGSGYEHRRWRALDAAASAGQFGSRRTAPARTRKQNGSTVDARDLQIANCATVGVAGHRGAPSDPSRALCFSGVARAAAVLAGTPFCGELQARLSVGRLAKQPRAAPTNSLPVRTNLDRARDRVGETTAPPGLRQRALRPVCWLSDPQLTRRR